MTLANIRDIAVVILIAELFVLALVVLVAAYYAVRGMRVLVPKARESLVIIYACIIEFGGMVTWLMRALLAPILFLAGLGAGLREGVAALRRR